MSQRSLLSGGRAMSATPCRLNQQDRPRGTDLEHYALRLDDRVGVYPFRSDRTFCGAWLACASMEVPACCRMFNFVNFVISAAMSTSRMRDSEAVRFSW